MATTSKTDILARTITVVSGIAKTTTNGPVTATSRMTDIGLTSMDLVNLMLAVEAEFDLTIPQTDITPENFRSVDSIVSMVARQFTHQQAA